MLESCVLSWKVAMRHFAVYRKNFFANILPTITDPAFYLLVFGYWLGQHVSEIHSMPYAQYLAPGMVLTTCLYTAFFEASYGFFVRMHYQSVYQAMVTTPVGAREILGGEFIWVALKGAAMSTVTALVLALLGVVKFDYLFLIPFIGGAVGLGCGAIGLFSAASVRNIDQFQTVYALVISPMFFVSGIFFPVEQLPPWIQAICHFSPLYHGVRLGQAVLWGQEIVPTFAKHGSFLAILCFALALAAVRKAHPKLYQ